MKRSNLVMTIATSLLVAATVFQSCKKDDDSFTTNCNDLDYSGCIECQVVVSADSTESTTLCRSDYNTESEFKDETCAGFAIATALGYDGKCRNID